MPLIHLQTLILAPVEVCFNLSRSIDLHVISTRHTGEKAVAGKTSGLIGLNETVTWRARHFGIWQHLTSRITACQYPVFFEDCQVSGAFRSFRHEHYFRTDAAGTLMTDRFYYEPPLGFLGRWANKLFLQSYMTRLLRERNHVIRHFAESGKWRELPGMTEKPWG